MTLNLGKKTQLLCCPIFLVFIRPCKENYSKQEEPFFFLLELNLPHPDMKLMFMRMHSQENFVNNFRDREGMCFLSPWTLTYDILISNIFT